MIDSPDDAESRPATQAPVRRRDLRRAEQAAREAEEQAFIGQATATQATGHLSGQIAQPALPGAIFVRQAQSPYATPLGIERPPAGQDAFSFLEPADRPATPGAGIPPLLTPPGGFREAGGSEFVVEPAVEAEPAPASRKAAKKQDAPARRGRTRPPGRKDGGDRTLLRRAFRRPLLAVYLVAGIAAAALVPSLWPSSETPLPSTALVSSGSFSLEPGQLRLMDTNTRFEDGSASASFIVPKRPTGGGLYFGLVLRATNRNGYYVKVRVLADGSMRLGYSRTVDGKETRLATTETPGRISGGETVHVEAKVSGENKVTLAGRAWIADQKRPGLFTKVDTGAVIKGAGSVSTYAYLSSTANAAITLPFEDVVALGAGEEAPGTTPTASPTIPTPTITPTMNPPTSTTVTSKPTSSTGPTTSPTGGTGGGGKPGSGNTGLPSGTKLTVHNGDMTISKAGQVVTGMDIRGFVTVTAPNVTIKNSIIRGGKATSGKGLIMNYSASATNLVVQDSTLDPTYPSVWLNGLAGGNFTAKRLDISGSVDGAQLHKNNVKIEDTWIHDLTWFEHDPNHGGGESHNDGIQILGGSNILVEGNNISGGDNAGMQITQDSSPVKGLKITNNWLDGGDCSIKLQHREESALGPVTITGNKFGGNTAIANCPILRTSKTTVNASGNVFSSGSAVGIRVDG